MDRMRRAVIGTATPTGAASAYLPARNNDRSALVCYPTFPGRNVTIAV